MTTHKPYTPDRFEAKVSGFIFSVTGIWPESIENNEEYVLRLGTIDPIEVGFIKKKHPNEADFKFSAHVALLDCFSGLIRRNPDDFNIWVSIQLANK